jgi:Outer membrane protein beta-barrel domain
MRRISVLMVTLLALSSPAVAQKATPVELGVDGALAFDLDSPRSTSLVIPVQRLRAGFFVTPTISLEPALSLNHFSFDGNSSTDLDFVAGVLFHLNPSRASAQPYIRPFMEILHRSFDGDTDSDSFNTAALGGGIGIKIPIADRFAWRLEGAYSHIFERDRVPSQNVLSAYFGFSFFTH